MVKTAQFEVLERVAASPVAALDMATGMDVVGHDTSEDSHVAEYPRPP